MNIISAAYLKLRLILARKDEKGEYSSGHIPSLVRDEFLRLCKGMKGKILEIGCGEGLFMAKLQSENSVLAIFGIDILRQSLARARNRLIAAGPNRPVFVEADAQKICFKDNTFDCVVCLNTLFNLSSIEHIRLVVIEALRVAKKGAEVIVDIRNKHDLMTSLRFKFVKYYDPECPVYLKQYEAKEIVEIFEGNSASIVEIKRIKAFLGLSTPITIIRAKKI